MSVIVSADLEGIFLKLTDSQMKSLSWAVASVAVQNVI